MERVDAGASGQFKIGDITINRLPSRACTARPGSLIGRLGTLRLRCIPYRYTFLL